MGLLTVVTTTPAGEGGDRQRRGTPTRGCLDCLEATMAATVAGGGEGGRLQGKGSRGSGSLVLKISWGEEGVTTVAVTVDTINTLRTTTPATTTRATTTPVTTTPVTVVRTLASATTS